MALRARAPQCPSRIATTVSGPQPRLRHTGRARPLTSDTGPGPRAVRVGPCSRRDSTSRFPSETARHCRRALRTSLYPRRAPRSGRWGQVATTTRTSNTGRRPGRVHATVRTSGARRSSPPRGRVSPLTREVDSDGGRGKGHIVTYSRYTAPEIAPSSVLISAITRQWRSVLDPVNRSLTLFQPERQAHLTALYCFRRSPSRTCRRPLIVGRRIFAFEIWLLATAYCRTPRPVLCR